MAEFRIQPFSDSDIDDAHDLWRNVEHLGISAADATPDLQRFLRANAAFSFTARAVSGPGQGVLNGTVLAGHDYRRGYIYHLATRGTQRRQGLASALLDASLQALAGANIRKCHAFVFRDNPYADLFWKQLGWQRRDELDVFSREIDTGSPSGD